jgi:hypothetical protein
MSRIIVDHLLRSLDEAFERQPNAAPSDGWHSLLANLDPVRDEDWDWLPANGKRTISHLALHCGFAYRLYADYGFGDATLPIGDAVYRGPPGKEPAIEWLRVSHTILHDAIATTTDDQLSDTRRTHWAEDKPRLWFAQTMIEHTLYHAGEVNHIRALAQDNDA